MTSADLAEGTGSDEPGDGSESLDQPAPYQFDPVHPTVAGRLLDRACVDARHYLDVDLALDKVEIPDGMSAGEALRRELLLAFTYQLRLDLDGRDGCRLVALGDGLVPPIWDVAEPVIRLWRETATAVAAPAAVARLEDLLFCRRDGNGRDRASRAAQAYLALAARPDIDMDVVEAVVRAWTLVRSVSEDDLEVRVRVRMVAIVEDVMDRHSGEHPGVVLPLLSFPFKVRVALLGY